jgi:pimeloyl-ACP methyl ester carboxylesterase
MKRLTILVISILCCTYSYAIIPDRNYVRLPQNVGLIYKELNVITADGYSIKTWFFPAQNFSAENASQSEVLPYKTLDESRRCTLIICNGDAGNMSYQQISLAALYSSCGINVITFDWRGFGESSEFEMNPDNLCYTEMLTDFKAVIKAACKEKIVDKKKIYVMGWSTGAYLAMITAHNSRKVKGCILSGTPSSFEDVIPHLIKVHPKGKTEANLHVPDDFPKEQMPAFVAPKFKKDILLVVGSEDNRTPLWMSEKIFNALPDGITKKLSIYEGAGHGGAESPFFVDWDRWAEETTGFMLSQNQNSL